MEWSKYVLSVMVGGCLLVLYGKKGTGRNKWLFGAGTGTSLMTMELAVEYMLNKAAWEMANSAVQCLDKKVEPYFPLSSCWAM